MVRKCDYEIEGFCSLNHFFNITCPYKKGMLGDCAWGDLNS